MTRALVLGGGGPVGITWESGLLNGLADGGVDTRDADFLLGTSAGSFVGARLALGMNPKEFAAPFLDDAEADKVDARPPRQSGPPPDLSELTRLMAQSQTGGADALKALGKYALDANTPNEADFIATFGAAFRDLPDDAWPQKNYACTAVDAESGAFKLWTAASKVGIKHAVSSSCAVPGIYPPITINGRRYMDGGMRSSINSDLATGYDKVLVIAVRATAPGEAGARMKARRDAEFKVLTDAGAQVHLLAPDAVSLTAMGANLMDFHKRGPAAAAGLAQGKAEAEALKAFWNS